jgi:Putative phage tail protein
VGSSKKQTVGYKYYLGMHMVLSHGPADALYQIKVDDREAWKGNEDGGQITIDAPGLFGGESREGGVSGLVDVEMGGPTQVANDYLSGLLDDVTGHRGVVGLILRKCYLGMNPYLKRWSALLQRIYLAQDGDDQWYAAKAGIPSGNVLTDIGDVGPTGPTTPILGHNDVVSYLTITAADATDYSSVDASGWATGPMPLTNNFSHPAGHNPASGTRPTTNEDAGFWIRKTVTLPHLGWIRVDMAFDNLAGFYVNGVAQTIVSTGVFSGYVEFEPDSLTLDLAAYGRNIVFGTGSGANPACICIDVAQYASGDLNMLDMNPAHIVRECLTNQDWGMGYDAADMDDVAFESCADALYDETFGLSLIWDRQIPIEDFIKEVLKHIDATLFVSRSTGKFVLKLIRADYDEGTLPLFDESNVEKVDGYSQRGFDELVNAIVLKYKDSGTNRDASAEIHDPAQVQMQQATISTTVNYPGISNAALAARVAARDLKSLSSQLITATLYTNRDAISLNSGDAFKWSWAEYGLVERIMRVTGMSLGDGVNNTIKLQCTEDSFALPEVSYIDTSGSEWEDINLPPAPAEFAIAFEAPYYEIVQERGQSDTDDAIALNDEIGFVGVAAVRPTGAINAVLSTDAGAGYEEAGTFNFCPSATIVDAITQMTTTVELDDGVSLDSVLEGSHAQIDDELIVVVSIVGTTLTFERGALDTVPAEHAASARIYFWDDFSGFDPAEYVDGETVNAKVMPITGQGQLAIGLATAMPVAMDSRAFRPYPPGDFKINDEYFPVAAADPVTVTWAHRDRLQQTAGDLLSFLDASVGPEAGTTYKVQASDALTDAVVFEQTGISGTSFELPTVDGAFDMKLRLWSVRGAGSANAAANAFAMERSLGGASFGSYIFKRFVLPSTDYIDVIYFSAMMSSGWQLKKYTAAGVYKGGTFLGAGCYGIDYDESTGLIAAALKDGYAFYGLTGEWVIVLHAEDSLEGTSGMIGPAGGSDPLLKWAPVFSVPPAGLEVMGLCAALGHVYVRNFAATDLLKYDITDGTLVDSRVEAADFFGGARLTADDTHVLIRNAATTAKLLLLTDLSDDGDITSADTIQDVTLAVGFVLLTEMDGGFDVFLRRYTKAGAAVGTEFALSDNYYSGTQLFENYLSVGGTISLSPVVIDTDDWTLVDTPESAVTESWQCQEHTFDYVGSTGRVADDGDERITDDGAFRALD